VLHPLDSIAVNQVYLTGPEDVLQISVYDNPDLSGKYIISSEGTITYPLLGQIVVAGMSVGAINTLLTEKLGADYIYNPIVSVTVHEFRSKIVKIIGNVGKPGSYALDKPTHLFEILTRAEGLSRNIANGQKVHILRQMKQTDTEAGRLKSYTIDLYQLLVEGEQELNIYLQNGDVIFVPETKMIHIIGEVNKPGSFPYEEGITVLKAITLAGGPTKKAATGGVVVKRIENNIQIEIDVNMSTNLSPDDIVEVPMSFW
jgi:polysaccharide export outer membrane protein